MSKEKEISKSGYPRRKFLRDAGSDGRRIYDCSAARIRWKRIYSAERSFNRLPV